MNQKVVEINKEMSLLASRRQLKDALELFDGLAKENLLNSYSYGIILNACVQCGAMDKADFFFEEMRQRRDKQCSSTEAYTTYVKGLTIHRGDLTKSAYLIREMNEFKLKSKAKKFHGSFITPNVRTFNTYLRGCLMYGDVEKAKEMYLYMTKTCNINGDESTFDYMTALLAAGLRLNDMITLQQDQSNQCEEKKSIPSIRNEDPGADLGPVLSFEPSLIIISSKSLWV